MLYASFPLTFDDLCFVQMMSERQRIESAPPPAAAAAIPSMDSMPAPPSYEEVNSLPTSPVQNGSADGMGYFLGEVSSFTKVMCQRNYY